ncbi:putative efflux protein, MATE family [Thermosyntropha lipolytica DSM 11003]|uniref:Putative efflux protein, MATE family n=1 Tax=Thermosyntropha lipolytica DSM 11003 TaxID=1123382 RepID=A0A1M5QJ20_9FIRM|nr:MATE family efflux transporter [Thermosyntropha lipolytica]SHH13780.1 putative efflux protein, MATE family [Thermosyntropha lipolytica DSM 11003]
MRFKGNLGEDSIGRLLITMSLPAMIGMTIQALYNIVDTFWVGKIGTGEAIAALTICFPIQMVMIAIASGTGIGLTSIISRRLGAKKVNDAVNAAEHGLLIVFIYAIITVVVGLLYIEQILAIFGVTPELYPMSYDYINIIFLGSILKYFAMMSGSMIQAEGNAGIPMRSMVTGAITNMVLDPFFIFGIAPFPALGVKGAAIATLIGQAAGAGINLHYLFFSHQSQLTPRLKSFKFNLFIFKEIYKVGFPSMIMQLVGSLILLVLNHSLAPYGYRAIAAMGIYFRVQSLIFMPLFGLNQGLIPIVGFNYGARNLSRMKSAIKKARLGAFILMSIGFIGFQLFPAQLVSIFNQDPELIELGVIAMRNITWLLPLVGPSIIMSSTFQAVGKGFTAMWLSLLRQVILLLPLLFILPRFWGIKGIWLAFPFSDFISITITALVFMRYMKHLEKHGFPETAAS